MRNEKANYNAFSVKNNLKILEDQRDEILNSVL